MTTGRMTLALTLLFVSASSATAADLSGTWAISSTLGPSPTCTFVQTGNSLNGTCEGRFVDGPAFGVVNGHVMRWAWEATTNTDQTHTALVFLGKLGPDNKIEGRIMSGPDAAPFSATSVKALRSLAEESDELAYEPSLKTCAEFIEGSGTDATLEDNYFKWARGFFEGYNKLLKRKSMTIRDPSSLTPEVQKSRIRSYCQEHPLEYYTAAVMNLYESMPLVPAENPI